MIAELGFLLLIPLVDLRCRLFSSTRIRLLTRNLLLERVQECNIFFSYIQVICASVEES